MHKRMLLVSERLAAVEEANPPSPLLDEARRALYRSQCNCAYWHGLFGGLYVNYLRHATYEQMIRADRLLDQITAVESASAQAFDYDRDGYEELLIASQQLLAIVKPHRGGALVELDWKPAAFNVLNTIARRREAYHERLLDRRENQPVIPSRTQGIPSIHELHDQIPLDSVGPLVVDRHLRHSFVDHLWRPEATLERVEAAEETDLVELFNAPYQLLGIDNGLTGCSVDLEWRSQNRRAPISLRKRYEVAASDACVVVRYSLSNGAGTALPFWLAVEFNFALLAGNAYDSQLTFEYADNRSRRADETHDRRLASRGTAEGLRAVSLADEHSRLRLRLSSSLPFDLWRFPVETFSQSEGGYDRSYQESALYCHWQVTLGTQASLDTLLTLTISPL
jgi:alpha-amylase